MKLRSNKGFSLVELIIVIAIMGIIAVIAVPNLTGIQKRSQVNADIRTGEQIGKAVRIWLTDSSFSEAETRKTTLGTKPAYSTLSSISDYIATGKKSVYNGADFKVTINGDYIEVYMGDVKVYSENASEAVSADAILAAEAGA